MTWAICEDCGSLVEAELTHNGVCPVGHYVHCGWGHQLSPDDLISDATAIEALTEQLEAARADAKEAEAYAEELEKERDHWQGVAGREGVCMTCHGPRGAPEPYGCSDCLNTGYCGEWHNQMQELREKLAKAVEALGRAKASIENGGGGGVTDVVWLDDPCPETLCDFIDATLAEIEGEKG
jgi:hypothetical protein